MTLKAAEQSKRYRDKLKQKQDKYNELKEKDRQRKAQKVASMTKQEKEKYLDNHRKAQQRYRKKLNSKVINQK